MCRSSVMEAGETKIKADRRPRVHLCGECGAEVGATELLCADCRKAPQTVEIYEVGGRLSVLDP